jgi:hypothetical protein
VAYLERAVADHTNVTIEIKKFVPDKVTGELREHDIVLTQRSPQRVTVTAIECRDRNRPVTVNQIEEFHTKCQDTGIDKRVIVSSTGFYNPARKKADRYGIDCLTFAQVEDVDWFGQREMIFRKREVRHANIGIGAPLSMQGKSGRLLLSIIDGPDEDLGIRTDAGGQIVMENNAVKLVDRILNQVPDPTSDLSGVWGIDIADPEHYYFAAPTQEAASRDLLGSNRDIKSDFVPPLRRRGREPGIRDGDDRPRAHRGSLSRTSHVHCR